eukprot:UN13418
MIFNEGNIGQHMFFINEGSIEIILNDENGNKTVVLMSGDFFGHQSIMNNTPRTYTARAQTVCELLSLSVDKFNELLDYEPNLPQMLQDEDLIAHIQNGVTDTDTDTDTESSIGENSNEINADYIEIEVTDLEQSPNEKEEKGSHAHAHLNNIINRSRMNSGCGGGLFPSSCTNSSTSNQIPMRRHSGANVLSGIHEI